MTVHSITKGKHKYTTTMKTYTQYGNVYKHVIQIPNIILMRV